MAKQVPRNVIQAQKLAARIARRFGTFECVACAKEIARCLRTRAGTDFLRLATSDRSDVIGLAEEGVQVSANQVHVAVRVGDKVFDNHHPEGVAAASWAERFVSATGAPLLQESKPVLDFFAKRFQTKAFIHWLFGD